MSETPATPAPPSPDESRVEAAARLAAEAAVAALLPRLLALEERDAPAPVPVLPPGVASKLAAMEDALQRALQPAALPPGVASKLAALEDALQRALQPADAPPAVLSDADRRTLDALRLAQAENARTIKQLVEKENS